MAIENDTTESGMGAVTNIRPEGIRRAAAGAVILPQNQEVSQPFLRRLFFKIDMPAPCTYNI